MPFEATVAAFAEALTNPALPVPAAALGREGRPDAKRFAVYRNNVAVALIASLEARFPVVRRLVGDAFFRAMAGAYTAAHKPKSPVLIDYGGDFAEFIETFPPAREVVYLADVARFENAWVESYHAAEAPPLRVADLAAIEPERLGELHFVIHPSARLLTLAHPAASIWAGHQTPGDPRPPEVWGPEDALIARPDAEVEVRVLPEGGHAFAVALARGTPLAEAAAPLIESGIDPGPHLVGLIEAGAFANIS